MIFQILYQTFVIWLAYKNAEWSNPNEEHKIKHWLNGLCHLTAAGLIGWFYGWEKGVSLLLLTRVIFDFTYNLRMDNGAGYVPKKPKSIVDKVEKWLILKLAGLIYRRKILFSETDIERTAIIFRVFILGLGIVFLII